ncbi:MAG: hypothetical protein R3A44_42815 [Caldilineaceae bacterium]
MRSTHFQRNGRGRRRLYDAPTQKVTIDEIYAVPLNAEPWFIHYRKSILEAKGLNPPFDSLEELRAALKRSTPFRQWPRLWRADGECRF